MSTDREKPLKEATDDELLQELALRNRAILFCGVRDIDRQGKQVGRTTMLHGGEMDKLALAAYLIRMAFREAGD